MSTTAGGHVTVTQTTCDMGGTRRPLLMTRADGLSGVGLWRGEDHLKSVLSLHSRVLFPKTSKSKRLVRHGMDFDSKHVTSYIDFFII